MSKFRLDVLLFERKLTESREKASALIMSGSVFVDGKKAIKPGTQVLTDCDIEISAGLQYVSRGGLKLKKALEYFNVSPMGKICIDCGASTGGFTDCLLQNGAESVYAVDVGYGQLAYKIRSDPRVVVMERTNIRYVTADMFEKKPEFAVADLSFISLKLVLPALSRIMTADSSAICLIKPQFEAGREKVGKKGVVRDIETHKEVLDMFCKNAADSGFGVMGLTFSPIKGAEGNIEYLGYLRYNEKSEAIDTMPIVSQAQESFASYENIIMPEHRA
jgi:23S rRNA (cytidine1920-2'-O)/16S rRNA (cytidine1409-2'-O)-methyltransferase